MSSPLTLIPFLPPAPDLVRAFTVRAERTATGLLQFHYRLEADLSRLRVPPLRERLQVDELWKHTCFEAFVAMGDEPAYRELNFAPSTEWAAYSFTGYRAGMAPIALPPPDLRVEATRDTLELSARVDMRALLAPPLQEPALHRPALREPAPRDSGRLHTPLRMAIAAVLEDDAGGITYWALRHAPARPDFHHPAGFILEV